MAILIEGMDFPKTCMACDLEIVDDEDYTTYCPLIYKGYTGKCREDGRLPDCPLVEAAEVQDAVSRQAIYDALMAEPLKWDGSSVWESARCYQWMMDMDVIKALSSINKGEPMKKLIYLEDAIDALDCINGVEEVLRALPSAQPDIVRCKDCKHYHYENGRIPYCDRIDYGYGWKDDEFCSRAERRTND